MFDQFDLIKKVDKENKVFYELHMRNGVEVVPNMSDVLQASGHNHSTVRKVVLPQSVKALNNFAFSNFSSLSEVNLPNGLERIEGSAFFGCENLKSINLPESLLSLGTCVFQGSGLESVEVPNSVDFIGAGAFRSCKNLKKVKLPESMFVIPLFCFRECVNLTQLEMPKVLNKIQDSAFHRCSKLEKIEIPDCVTSISQECFAGCWELKDIRLPESLKYIGDRCFFSCGSLEKINIPDGVTIVRRGTFDHCVSLQVVEGMKNVVGLEVAAFNFCSSLTDLKFNEGLLRVDSEAFQRCNLLKTVELPSTLLRIGANAFAYCSNLKKVTFKNPHKDLVIRNDNGIEDLGYCNYFYFDRENGGMTITTREDVELAKHSYVDMLDPFLTEYNITHNYRKNFVTANKLKEMHSTRYIPQRYIMEMFPCDIFGNYYKNKNDIQYGRLVRELGFDLLVDGKEESLNGLFKIYYALGGFSENPLEARKAYDYVLNDVVVKNDFAEIIGSDLHERFTGFQIERPYNPMFAQFFMKYYRKDHNFMWFDIDTGGYHSGQDYLWSAHNNFDNIVKAFPNRTVNTNERRACLTPRFVAEHCNQIVYNYVNIGNKEFAGLVGRYGYSQAQFERMQEIFDSAKVTKGDSVICADEAKCDDAITFRVLEKDDPLGFVLGDITNCCQRFGSEAESCVIDGYTNKNAGFLVFEENVKDGNGCLTDEKRILAQAYIYYDPETKTICYDNIEIPTNIINELRYGKKTRQGRCVTYTDFDKAVNSSAVAIMNAMNRKGVAVERVTIGAGYNDLKEHLSGKYHIVDKKNMAVHRSYYGYSDSRGTQYEIKNINKEESVLEK
ncbi:MAG: leucine-rich repeat domain-containing protein [Clostridia bacterium]|nr:leucine-rich repeat domain-containing protein [Clostridia bacterium]